MHVDKNVSNDFLYNPGNNPSEKKYWNFKAVFLRNSAGIPEVNIWNHSGTLMEFHWNITGIMPPILSKFTACFPELFR